MSSKEIPYFADLARLRERETWGQKQRYRYIRREHSRETDRQTESCKPYVSFISWERKSGRVLYLSSHHEFCLLLGPGSL